MKLNYPLMLFMFGLISLNAGCAHTVMGERTAARSEPVNSLLIVFERKNYTIERRPEGGFYENGIVAQQLKLEQELKTSLVDQLQKHGVSSEFMPIPAVLGSANENALSWNSAIGKDRFPYVLVVVPGNGTLHCRSGGYNCSAAFAVDFKVIRRSDNVLVWKGRTKSVDPSMLASTPENPSSLVRQLTEKLSGDGVIRLGSLN